MDLSKKINYPSQNHIQNSFFDTYSFLMHYFFTHQNNNDNSYFMYILENSDLSYQNKHLQNALMVSFSVFHKINVSHECWNYFIKNTILEQETTYNCNIMDFLLQKFNFIAPMIGFENVFYLLENSPIPKSSDLKLYNSIKNEYNFHKIFSNLKVNDFNKTHKI